MNLREGGWLWPAKNITEGVKAKRPIFKPGAWEHEHHNNEDRYPFAILFAVFVPDTYLKFQYGKGIYMGNYAIQGIESLKLDNMPQGLRAQKQWVAWKAVSDPKVPEKKPRKVPISPGTGQAASSTDPTTWGAFEEAVARCANDRLAGVGFVFHNGDEVGVDFDGVMDAGEWTNPAISTLVGKLKIGKGMATYAEISPSGKGFKVFCKGVASDEIKGKHKIDLPGGAKAEIEIYTTSRFFTLTGHAIGSKDVEWCQPLLDAIENTLSTKAKTDPVVWVGAAGDRNGIASKYENEKIRAALSLLDADDRAVWLNACNALKNYSLKAGDLVARELWDEFSKRSKKYDPVDQEKLWMAQSPNGNAKGVITLGTIFAMAKNAGWNGEARDINGTLVEPHTLMFDGPPGPLVERACRLEFPIDVLPPVYRHAAEAIKKALGWEVGAVASSMIAAVSAAACDKWSVAVRGKWIEALPWWSWIVSHSGSKKSALMKIVRAPLDDDVREKSEEYFMAQQRHKVVEERNKERIRKLIKSDDEESKEEAAKLFAEIENRPRRPDYTMSDATPEAAAEDMWERKDEKGVVKLAFVSSEGGEVVNSCTGHYSEGRTNNGIYLKGYDGEIAEIKRKGSAKAIVNHPLVVMALTVQPEVVSKFFSKNAMLKGEGFLPRCNFVLSDSAPAKWKDADMDPQVCEAYTQAVVRIARGTPVCDPGMAFALLNLSKEAAATYGRHYDWLEEFQRDPGPLGHWPSKLSGKTIRLAGLLHLMWGYDEAHEISEAIMRGAIRLADWYTAQAKAVAVETFGDSGEQSLKVRIAQWIIERRGRTVKVSEIYNSLKHNGAVEGVDTIRDILDELTELGYVHPICADRNKGPQKRGRPRSPEYAVNPFILADGWSWKADALSTAHSPEISTLVITAAPGVSEGQIPESIDLTDTTVSEIGNIDNWLSGLTCV